jgi:hypothetical protein
MRSGLHGVSPDEQGACILLKFANQRDVGDEVRMRSQRFFAHALGKVSVEYRARTLKGEDGHT